MCSKVKSIRALTRCFLMPSQGCEEGFGCGQSSTQSLFEELMANAKCSAGQRKPSGQKLEEGKDARFRGNETNCKTWVEDCQGWLNKL